MFIWTNSLHKKQDCFFHPRQPASGHFRYRSSFFLVAFLADSFLEFFVSFSHVLLISSCGMSLKFLVRQVSSLRRAFESMGESSSSSSLLSPSSRGSCAGIVAHAIASVCCWQSAFCASQWAMKSAFEHPLFCITAANANEINPSNKVTQIMSDVKGPDHWWRQKNMDNKADKSWNGWWRCDICAVRCNRNCRCEDDIVVQWYIAVTSRRSWRTLFDHNVEGGRWGLRQGEDLRQGETRIHLGFWQWDGSLIMWKHWKRVRCWNWMAKWFVLRSICQWEYCME